LNIDNQKTVTIFFLINALEFNNRNRTLLLLSVLENSLKKKRTIKNNIKSIKQYNHIWTKNQDRIKKKSHYHKDMYRFDS
jgi:hypothetical protein